MKKKFEIIALTDRRLCPENFLDQLAAVAASGVDALVLREKDLSPEAYEALALKAAALCRQGGAEFIVHQFAPTAAKLGVRRLHLPLGLFEAGPVPRGIRTGVAVHSLEEARRAAARGADYLIAGHIFPSPSHPGLPGRDLPFLEELCRELPIPVYAIGGVAAENIRSLREAGAAGACILSPYMLNSRPAGLTTRLRAALLSGIPQPAAAPGLTWSNLRPAGAALDPIHCQAAPSVQK